MAGGSIKEPGVEVVQEYKTSTPTVITPTLLGVVVGPCIQIVDAFDDDGSPLADALAGTYRDGSGVIAYSLPNLSPGAILSGLEDKIRAFLVYGRTVRELGSESDEVIVDSGTTGVFTKSSLLFKRAGALWKQLGVEAGDVVRFSYRGEATDFTIASVDSDTQLTLASAGVVTEATLNGVVFSLIRNPAEFVYSTGTQANVELGDTTNFLRISAKSSGEYFGSKGDQVTLVVTDSDHYADGAYGACGESVFGSATATFSASVGALGSLPTNRFVLIGAPGTAKFLKQIFAVATDKYLAIEGGAGVGLTAQTYHLTQQWTAGVNGVTNVGGTIFTSAGAAFTTLIPNTAGTPTDVTYVEIEGASGGTYEVVSVDSDTQLTITAGPVSLTARVFTVVSRTATASDGTTAALTTFLSPKGGLSSIPNTAGTPSQVTYISTGQGAGSNKILSAIVSDTLGTVTAGFGASFVSTPWQAVDAAADLKVSFDPDQDQITIQLARVAGVSSSTYAQILAAFNTLVNPAYNAVVGANFVAQVVGTGTLLGTDVSYAKSPISVELDGGSDDQDLLLDADLLGSVTPTASLYVSYRALRIDVSPAAVNPRLTEVVGVDDIVAKLGKISIENPLALGAYFASLAAPSRPIKVLGVSDVSATKPEGTVVAYAQAYAFLEGQDVYAIASMTHDPVVHALVSNHVTSMSEPESKSERIAIVSQVLPLFTKAQVLGSGADGNTGATFTASATAEFAASVDFEAAGIQAGDVLVISALATSAKSPTPVAGTLGPLYGIRVLNVMPSNPFVLVLDGTQAGVSTDWNSVIDVDFAVYREGVAISQPVDQAEVIAQIGEGFDNRRVFHCWPDVGSADVAGTEQLLPGYYLTASVVGKISQVQPEQGLTNLTFEGWTGLKHTNGYFSKRQLNRMAGGGTMIMVQDSSSAPIRCRHQLSTDVSTLEKREMSITKVIDYAGRFLRLSLVKHTGKFNITPTYLDSLTVIIHGLLKSLADSGRVKSAKLVSLGQDEIFTDLLQIQVALYVYSPANYIVLTIVV